jgi:hypothetical protein
MPVSNNCPAPRGPEILAESSVEETMNINMTSTKEVTDEESWELVFEV